MPFQINFENDSVPFFSMKLMDSFVKYNYSLHDIPTRHKGSLCRTHHFFGYNVKLVCPHLCEDLKANIKDTNWSGWIFIAF
jgi:hypothetical protein